ncbi:MAG: histidine--tRNA ligase, partial [Microbacterium sp.]
GGGRYDGMIGRFLGQQIPAVGFSLGFERLADLLEPVADAGSRAIVLVHDADVPLAELIAHKSALMAHGRVRLERRPKNFKALLERSAADGYNAFVTVSAGAEPGTLELKPLS